MTRSIIITGAGIAGPSAGCYGQMNGYTTQILEKHDGSIVTNGTVRAGFVPPP